MKHITLSIAALGTILTANPQAWAYSTEIYAVSDITDGVNDAGDTKATAALLDGYYYSRIIVAGDANNMGGTYQEYQDHYAPYWGSRLYDTWPVPGNHDYGPGNPDQYMAYFEMSGVNGGKTYYDYTQGGWHFIALDSECAKRSRTCADTQLAWLRQKLQDHADYPCTLAYYHHPRFTSGEHGNNSFMGEFWTALYDGGADVVINGHDHDYERFAAMDPSGNRDSYGMYEFVVGTGGAELRNFRADIHPSSDVRIPHTNGVLWMGLNPTSFDFEFVNISGGVGDANTTAIECYY